MSHDTLRSGDRSDSDGPQHDRLLLSHEWIAAIGGSENVFRELLAAFPGADATCLWNDVPETFDRPIGESRLASSRLRGKKALSLPFMPGAWRDVRLDDYDTVLASSHAFGHHLAGHAARSGRRAFSYVHTPARYIWAPEVEVRGQGIVARAGSIPLRRIDRRAVDDRVSYAANSRYIRDRIRRAWDVDAEVIYPPVDVARITSVDRWIDHLAGDRGGLAQRIPREEFILGASRLVSYKRLDLVIEVGESLGMPVVIAGSGPDEAKLREQGDAASVPVTFTGRVSDEQLYALYQEASLFVFLPVEDFGIMPVEAMATGTPVLVSSVGGASESVTLASGGVVVGDTSSTTEIRLAAEYALAMGSVPDVQAVATFSLRNFRETVTDWLYDDKGHAGG